MGLNTRQKTWLFIGDAIATIGIVAAGSSMLHPDGPIEAIATGGFAVLFGIILALIGIYQFADQKPAYLYMIVSIMFSALALFATITGLYDKNKQIAGIGVVAGALALIGLNISAFKPDDVKAFNAINLTYTAIGLALVGFGVGDQKASNSSAYIIIGALMISLASVSTSLAVYNVGM